MLFTTFAISKPVKKVQKIHWAAPEWRQQDFESGVGAPFPCSPVNFILFYNYPLWKEHVAPAAV